MSVKKWPSYVFHKPAGLPPALRAAISAEAKELDVSLADTMRGILCARYGLDCPPVSWRYDESRDKGAEKMVLRVQPELFQAMQADKRRRGVTMRALILEALEAHYAEVTA